MELISAKYLLTLNNSDEPIEGGAIAVELGKIEGVGTKDELKERFSGALEIDHPTGVIMPGLINSHSQIDLTNLYEKTKSILSDSVRPADHVDWLVTLIKYRQSAATTELIDAIQKGAEQAIEHGTTCLSDSTSFEGAFNILGEMGIRAILFNEIYGGRSENAQDLFENALAIVESHFNPSKEERLNAGLAPASPYLLSKNLLRIISRHSQDSEVPIKIHAAESFYEMEFFFDSKGPIGEKLFPQLGWGAELPPSHQKTPLGYLDEIGFLDSSPAIVGGLHLSEKCLKLLARHVCRVIHCPTNNNYFGHGTMPIQKLQTFGIPIGIGTGSPHKPQALSMWDEMREILKDSPGEPTPKEIVQMATIGGARVLGLENQIGTLAPGKLADYIVVDLPPGYEIDKAYIYGALIRNTHHFNVKKTVVGGEVLKSI